MRGKHLSRLEERFTIARGGYIRVFPDPYHRGPNVGLVTWVLRELDELIYGEA